MSGSYKNLETKTDLSEAISNFYSEVQSLRDEMSEWADNMESNNLGSTPKFDEVSQAKNALDGFADLEPDVPDGMNGVELVVIIQVPRRKRQNTSRAVRCGNAAAHIEAVVAWIEEEKDRLEKLDFDPDLDEDGEEVEMSEEERDAQVSALEELRDTLQDHADQAQGVEFPGMF